MTPHNANHRGTVQHRGNVPEIAGLTVKLTQDGNACGSTGEYETITVRLEDGGGGLYPVIATEGWSAEDGAELARLVDRVMGMATDTVGRSAS